MKNTFRLSAILFLTAITAIEVSARMGETIAQCDQRYGAPKQSPSDNMFALLSGPGVTNRTYVYQGWRIKTAFIKGRAAMLRYSKVDAQKIQDDEVQAILKAETYGDAWTEKSQYSVNPAKYLQNAFTKPRLWTNGIGAEAYFENPQYLSFVVKAPIVDQYNKAKADAAEQKRKSAIPEF